MAAATKFLKMGEQRLSLGSPGAITERSSDFEGSEYVMKDFNQQKNEP